MMVLCMQVIKGIATGVNQKQENEAGPAECRLKVNGQAAFIDVSGNGAEVAPIQNGDEVIIAGEAKKGLINVLAYKNLTQDQATTHTPSIAQEGACAWFGFWFGAVMLRLSWSSPATDQNLFPLPQWFTIGFGGMVLFFGAISLWLVADKCAARRLVDRAALETLVGKARIVEPERPDRYPKVEVQGLTFILGTSRRLRIEDGDRLAVTLERTKDGLIPLAFANLTRSARGHSSTAGAYAWGMAATFAFAGFVAYTMSDWLYNDDGNAFLFAIGVGLITAMSTIFISNFYRWKLAREALRLTEIAAQKHG